MLISMRVPFFRSPASPSIGCHWLLVAIRLFSFRLRYSTVCERLYAVRSRGFCITRLSWSASATRP